MITEDVAARFVRLHVLHRMYIRKKTNTEGLHDGQLPLLEAIAMMPGTTQQDLSEKLLVSPASIALSAKRLEKAGLIRRTQDEKNRRRNMLSVTEEGAKLAKEHRLLLNEADAEMLRGFTENELIEIADYFDRMIANIISDSGLEVCIPESKGGPTAK